MFFLFVGLYSLCIVLNLFFSAGSSHLVRSAKARALEQIEKIERYFYII